MKNFALKRIQQMQCYAPPLDGRSAFRGMLLDFNEKTVPPSKKVLRSLKIFANDSRSQVYPEYFDLEKSIARYAGVKQTEVMSTNGSDQGIDIVFRTFTEKDSSVIIPTPSFAMFEQCAGMIGTVVRRPLYAKDTLTFPFAETLRMITNKTRLIVICNPNNPTGTILSIAEIARIAQKANNAIILIDEAYYEFSQITAVPLLKKYSNIIITRTFSKAFGLAGLRLGYIIANPTYIEEMKKVRGPYDVNMAAYGAAVSALSELKTMKTYARQVMQQAKPMVEQFFRDNSIVYYPSAANFILFKPDNAKEVVEKLKAAGILLRPQNKTNIEGTVRVSIGTVVQMKQFIRAYTTILAKTKKKYAFIDRDGTLLFEPQDTFQIDSIKKLKMLDGVIEGLRLLQKNGYALVMVSNQNGIGTPSFPKKSFEAPHNKLLSVLKKNGIQFERIFICPHLPQDGCACRKPKIGLVKTFLKSNKIDTAQSFVCGDRQSDREFANNLGLRFVPMKTNGNFFTAITPLIKNV